MKPMNVLRKYGSKVGTVVGGAALTLAFTATSAMAALDPAIDTSIAAAQADSLLMIGKGYGYLGSLGGALVVLGFFWKILRRPAR